MKNLSVVWYVCLTMFGLAMFSCQQLPEDDGWLSGEEVKSLKVKVRSADEAEIVYPIYLYAFSEDGKLAASQTIEDAEKEMSLLLSKDEEFQVVAVAGISDAYQLPESPDIDDVITLTGSEGAETPLMVGRVSVDLEEASSATVTIGLSYAVAALNVELKEVPENVSAVQLALSPLHSTLSMGGEYGGTSQKVKVDCTLASEGVWSANTVYIFPGNATETVFSIYFKMDDGSEVIYGYTFQGAPKANHLFNVTGTYTGGVVVGGSFSVDGWEGAVDAIFNFGANVVPDSDEDEEEDEKGNENGDDTEEDEPEIDLTNVPEVGTIWNDMIVVDIGEADEDGVDLLLMSLDEWEIVTDEVGLLIEGYTVNGISGWRLPDYNEATLIRARFSGDAREELNELIAAYDSELYGLSASSGDRYLCLKNEQYYSFSFAPKTNISPAESRTYYARLVKTYHFVPEES